MDEGRRRQKSRGEWKVCTHSPLLVVLDLGIGLETEPLGDRSVLSSGFRKTGLDSEGLLGRLEGTRGRRVSVRFEVEGFRSMRKGVWVSGSGMDEAVV